MNNYRLKDMYLAAYLYSQGLDLIKVERDGKVCWFNFESKTQCESLANLYWSDKAEVKVKSFVEAIRSLKDIIFASS